MANIEWEMQAYGMTEADIDKMVAIQAMPVPNGKLLFAAGLLSDAQQVIDPEFNQDGWVDPETANRARQYINIAKYIMFKTGV
jgi:hypothetical protein